MLLLLGPTSSHQFISSTNFSEWTLSLRVNLKLDKLHSDKVPATLKKKLDDPNNYSMRGLFAHFESQIVLIFTISSDDY